MVSGASARSACLPPRAATLEFMLPGNPLTATGGYEYDRRMSEGLRALGWTVRMRSLDPSFPIPSERALGDAQRQLAALPEDALVLIDGLALGAMPELMHQHAQRLRLIALVHHPLAAETGLPADLAARLARSERSALQAVRRVLVTSHSTRHALAGYGVAATRIAVVEPGVDRPRELASQSHGSPPAAQRTAGSGLRMLCVATLTPRKGHELLVDALSGLRRHAWTLNCVGDLERSPETVAALRMRIAAAGLDTRITLTGELDAPALARQFRAADLFVLATRFEGYGMAVAQALSYGLPVISTRTGAIPELVSPQAGLLVEPNDGHGLHAALARVLLEPTLGRDLASHARRIGAGLPDWMAVSRHFAAALLEAMELPPPPSAAVRA